MQAEQESIEEVRVSWEMMKQCELDIHDRSAWHELRGIFDDEEEENVLGDHEDDVQEEWNKERKRLSRAREQWELY